MKRQSRHKRNIQLLKELVENTGYYVAHVWNDYGASIHGEINDRGEQRFIRPCECYHYYFTPWLGKSCCNKVFFALMPKKGTKFGLILAGWKELKAFVRGEVAVNG